MGCELTKGDRLSLIVGLSIPSILAQITTVMMFFIDTSMVGHLGAEASASIGLVESTTWLMGSVMSAVSMGFSVQVAHFIGSNDFVKARQVFRHAVICGIVFSMFMSIIGIGIHNQLPIWLGGGDDIVSNASSYFLVYSLTLPIILLWHLSSATLKSAGSMKAPSIVSVVLCVLDVAFNYIFIYVLGLGVIGAAIGTSCAYLVTVIPMVWLVTVKNKIMALRLDHVKFHWISSYVRNAVKISGPIAIQSILMSGAQVVSTLIVAPLGNIAIAANSFAVTAESLCYMPGYGIGDAATTLVGQTIGAKRMELCRSFARMAVGLGMGVMAFMGFIMYIFAPEMIGILSPVEEIRSLGTQILRIEAFAEPFFAASIVSYSVFVGAGDTFKPAKMNLCSMWLVRLTLAWWLSSSFGLVGVWIAMAVELVFRGCLFLFRLFFGDWVKQIKLS